jgi:hypothetical protein
MSRWIVALMMVVASASAHAEIVIRGPELTFTCPSATSLDALRTCIEQRGWTYKLVRTFAHARLIEVNAPRDPVELVHDKTPSLAIYVENARGGGWRLGGLFEPGGGYELLDAQPLTIGHTNGYRLDVGVTTNQPLVFDGAAIQGIQHVEHVVFCTGLDYGCTDVVPSCDWVADGHVVSSFHGDVHLVDRSVHVDGDSALAAPSCAGATEIPLAWP